MRYIIIVFVLILSPTNLAKVTAAEFDFVVGLRRFSVAGQPDRPLTGFLWYPATSETAEVPIGESDVWQGVLAVKNASAIEGRYPLVVLSHGWMGHPMNQAWLARNLVKQGAVVISVAHPGTNAVVPDSVQIRRPWERPRDLSRAIDAILETPEIGRLVDRSRIAAVGHSLGGTDVALLLGAQFDSELLDRHCKSSPGGPDCHVAQTIDLMPSSRNRAKFEADLSDPRIRAGITLDIGMTRALNLRSLSQVERPMLVIGAGRTPEIQDLDLESRALIKLLPLNNRRYRENLDLGHFDALGLCKPNASATLAARRPSVPPICASGDVDRQRMHDWMSGEIQKFLVTYGILGQRL